MFLNKVVRFFLRMKAWQLFLLLMAPLVLGFWIINEASSVEEFEEAYQKIGHINNLFAGFYFGWIFSVGYSANNKVALEYRRSPILFVVGLLFAAGYTLLAQSVLGISGTNWNSENMLIILPFHLLAMLGVLHAFWFAARQFATAKEGSEVKFADFSKPFFSIWFIPIGVWYLQPQVNRLLGGNDET